MNLHCILDLTSNRNLIHKETILSCLGVLFQNAKFEHRKLKSRKSRDVNGSGVVRVEQIPAHDNTRKLLSHPPPTHPTGAILHPHLRPRVVSTRRLC